MLYFKIKILYLLCNQIKISMINTCKEWLFMDRKKVVYFDMDGVLVDFMSGVDQFSSTTIDRYWGNLDEIPNVFSKMKPNIEVVNLFNAMETDDRYDCYLLSTASWGNPSAWSDKLKWVQKNIPLAYKKLILSHNKHLNIGDYLIDDRLANGSEKFKGKLLQYGTDKYPNAQSLRTYFKI